MKVLQIHNQYRHYGGEDAVVANEQQLLSQRGITVAQLFFENDRIRAGKLFFNRESYEKTLEKIEEFQPDVAHVHNLFYEASPAVLKALKSKGVPVVMTLHNYRLLCTGALFLRNGKVCTKCKDLTLPIHGIRHGCFKDSAVKSAALSSLIGYTKTTGVWRKYVDRFIVLTPFIKSLFESSSLKLPAEQLMVKPNSTDDFQAAHAPSGSREGFLFVGRLSVEKGVDILVREFSGLKHKLTLIGDGPLLEELKAQAGPNITFMGRQSKTVIGEQLAQAKALVFPSVWYEGLPNTIIEAFSSGTPIIASDLDNINTLVTHQKNGLVFNPKEAGSLQKVLEETDADQFAKLGLEARKTYEQHYTHEANYNSLLSIYNALTP
ncbi:Glycosyltransferase involved in cell wall bisynthesis [Robiginitalea myxolifaciens]|uniref:Glycosyltransferase involved in cell wall bisynthesis n=1 Tax=Robiginitalea myxolifaciens TaxID=400055 RepID=A0A1I6G2N8_9FLAO|nr:glycosyltransferase family 4 protein [Robiginitalea myxolifaciens]SFR36390.1 Glycosyltransferase involved in cell wall bisynthesis [Robiginitalea myxolifaciens]